VLYPGLYSTFLSVFTVFCRVFQDDSSNDRLAPSYGRAWESFLEGFKSRPIYEARVADFESFVFEKTGKQYSDLTGNDAVGYLIDYFDNAHAKEDGEGRKTYAATTLRSWFSVFLKLWSCTGRGDLRQSAQIIENNLSKWEKSQVVVKAKTFLKEDLRKNFTLFFKNMLIYCIQANYTHCQTPRNYCS
jgi:hypothetical protein